MAKFSGGCICGAVRYQGEAEPLFMGDCHCMSCQKESGAGHSAVIAVPEAAMKVTGKLNRYEAKADSGATVARHFCPTCGVRAYSTTSSMPGVLMIAAGALDDREAYKPAVAIYASRAPSWDRPRAGVPSFPEMPPAG